MVPMAKTWQVALIMKSSQRYDRRIVRGVAARVHETGNWSLYVEEDPNLRIPEMKNWHWDGINADFDDRKTAEAVRGHKDGMRLRYQGHLAREKARPS
jgi:hypothetical protein